MKFSGLTYKNIIYNDDDSAVRGSWGLWIPDSDEKACKKQLSQILPKITNSKSQRTPGLIVGDLDLVLICIDMGNPFQALDELKKWVNVMNDFVQWNCSTDSLELLAQHVRKQWD